MLGQDEQQSQLDMGQEVKGKTEQRLEMDLLTTAKGSHCGRHGGGGGAARGLGWVQPPG